MDIVNLIPEIGQFSLIVALCVACIQIIFPLVGAVNHRILWMQLAKPAAQTQAALVLFSFCCLTFAFITNDFSVWYVAANSNSHLPLFYRIAAVWGGHEGSILLWVTVLALWTLAVCHFSRSLPFVIQVRVIAVLGFISAGFLLFLLMTSNPFQRLLPDFPADGQDLNPLLQDPGMVFHPPLLYMGYVGFAVPYAFSMAALMSRRLDAAWARWTRPWTLAAWSFLTIGIVLGSGWAYRVLGWGGWWFWDPVENASFLPWLTGTALIHSLIVVEKRNAFKSWTALLAICAFALSLMGTFLVRSGILTSVHAFATDPSRGTFMLLFLVIVVSVSLLLYALRAGSVRGQGGFDLLSRETLLLTNNVLLIVMMATILLGTLYPLILDVLGVAKLSVGPPYFNKVFIPFMILLLMAMGIGPLCRWQTMSGQLLFTKIRFIAILAISAAILLPLMIVGTITVNVVLGLSLAIWVVLATVKELLATVKRRSGSFHFAAWRDIKRNQYGMTLAHLGIAACVIGVTLLSAYHVERDLRMSLMDSVAVGPYQFQFQKINPLQGPNYTGQTGIFQVRQQGKLVSTLEAEKRIYSVSNSVMTRAAIEPGIWRDLYVALGEPLSDGSWSVRIYYKPFVRWIWAGGILMMLGGLLAASDRRYRGRVD